MQKIQNELKNSIIAGAGNQGYKIWGFLKLSTNGAFGGFGKDNAFMIPVNIAMIGKITSSIYDIIDNQALIDKGYKQYSDSFSPKVRLGSGGGKSGLYF